MVVWLIFGVVMYEQLSFCFLGRKKHECRNGNGHYFGVIEQRHGVVEREASFGRVANFLETS